MRGVLHDGASQRYRIFRELNAGDRSCGEIAAIHDRSVHLLLALFVERRSTAGVELRIILELDDSSLDCVERRPLGLQLSDRRRERAGQASPVFGCRLRVHVFPLRGTGATVDGDRPLDGLLGEQPDRKKHSQRRQTKKSGAA